MYKNFYTESMEFITSVTPKWSTSQYNLSATVKHEVDDVKLQFISLFLFYLFIISVIEMFRSIASTQASTNEDRSTTKIKKE